MSANIYSSSSNQNLKFEHVSQLESLIVELKNGLEEVSNRHDKFQGNFNKVSETYIDAVQQIQADSVKIKQKDQQIEHLTKLLNQQGHKEAPTVPKAVAVPNQGNQAFTIMMTTAVLTVAYVAAQLLL